MAALGDSEAVVELDTGAVLNYTKVRKLYNMFAGTVTVWWNQRFL